MLPREVNELLTHTGPGTACGDLLRRYWQPVGLSEEIPPGGDPIPLKILGEELVLFRPDASGRPDSSGREDDWRTVWRRYLPVDEPVVARA